MLNKVLYRNGASSMWHAQEHFNSYTQPIINLVSAHILARVWLCLFYTFLAVFLFVCLFYKIKTKEHSNLHKATLLRRFRFYVGEIQGFTIKYKDFSRLCEPCSKTTSKDELDIRRVTLKYFVKGFNFDALN